MTVENSLRILLVALTFKRPDDLEAVLPLLDAQARSVDADVHVLIVDNDPAASAESVVADFARDRKVHYAHVPQPGIAAARNRALDESVGYDLLVFIDDDERPVDDWLAHLVATWTVYHSAAVVGPVISEYAIEPEDWISAGRFFDRRRLPTGTVIEIAATNNLLLDLRQLGKMDLRFDERFGLSGGSDTLFTRQIHASGRTMVWCDEAIVIDVVPESRLTRQWVLQRAFRSGNTWIRTSLAMAPTSMGRLRVRIVLSARGAVRVGGGLALAGVGLASGSLSRRARGLRTVARGAGIISGALGSVYSEYRRA
jgi:glycosyltransferase involved in cell wall biosynthesis